VVFKALSKAQADRYTNVMAFHTELVHAAAIDRQVHTLQTPAPLWLPPESAPAEPDPEEPPADSSSPARKVAPTALLPPAAPTARIPEGASTARIVATAMIVDDARLGPAGKVTPTTLRAAAASHATSGAPRAPGRHGLVVGAAVALTLVAGAGYWWMREMRKPVPVVSAAAPAALPPPPTVVEQSIPKWVRIKVENGPPGLRVRVDDGVPKEIPFLLPLGPDIHTLSFEAPGYQPTEFHVDGSRARTLVLAMKPRAEGSAGQAPAGDDIAHAGPPAEEEPAPKKGRASSKRHRRQSDILTDR
jgi:hypothetical protein